MSVHVMSLVWASSVPAPERFTLLALADRADEEGVCWPAIGTLAKKCCTGESTIRRHLRSLKRQGVLTVQLRVDNSSVYTIHLGRLRDLDQGSQSDTSQSGRGSHSGRGKQTRPGKTDQYPSQNDPPSQGDTPRQSDADTPTKSNGHPSQSGGQYVKDPSVDPSGGARSRGTRIPDDFHADADMIAWARKNTPLVGLAETEQFVDYWQAESGAKARKIDWVKAWKVWMRREQKQAEQRGGNHLRSVPTYQPELPTDCDAALVDLRERADAKAAANLIGEFWADPPRRPSDTTPHEQFIRRARVAFIDDHADRIRTALAGRQAG